MIELMLKEDNKITWKADLIKDGINTNDVGELIDEIDHTISNMAERNKENEN